MMAISQNNNNFILFKRITAFIQNPVLLPVIIFALVLLAKLPIITMPCHWDDIRLIKQLLFINGHGFESRIIPISDIGHPPFFYIVLSAISYIFGQSILIFHLVVIAFAFIGVYFTYLLGSELSDKKTGFIAALLLFSSPLYFAQTGTLNFDLPLTALTPMVLYFFRRRSIKAYILSAACMALIKTSGLLLILSVMIYDLVLNNDHKNRLSFLRKFLIHGIVLAIFAAWAAYHALRTGWLIFPGHFHKPFAFQDAVQSLSGMIAYIFFADYRFLITGCIIYVVFGQRIKTLFIVSLLICMGYFISVISRNSSGLYLSTMLYGLIYVLTAVKILFKNREYMPILLFISLGIIFVSIYMSVSDFLPRYSLIVYPFYFIIAAGCLTAINKKFSFSLLYILLFSGLSISCWHGYRNAVGGHILESNLEYLDQVKTHRLACKFIRENYPQSTVLTNWPQTDELTEPALGYVDHAHKVIDAQGFKNKAGAGYAGFDLVYYSPESGKRSRETRILMGGLNLALVRSYESNKKTALIYKVMKE